jgi:hypothetical protein
MWYFVGAYSDIICDYTSPKIKGETLMGLNNIDVIFDISFFVMPVVIGILVFLFLKRTLEKNTRAAITTSFFVFLVSLLDTIIHESAHFLIALAQNLEVIRIVFTNQLTGVVIIFESLQESAAELLLVSISGPLAGIILGIYLTQLGSPKGSSFSRGLLYGGHLVIANSLINLIPLSGTDGVLTAETLLAVLNVTTITTRIIIASIYASVPITLAVVYFYKVIYKTIKESRQTKKGVLP